MSKIIKLRKGLDIKLEGAAEWSLARLPLAASYAVRPADFPGVVPKLLVQAGDSVQAGTPLFFDKARPEVLFTSPVSGTVREIDRGDKRKLLGVVIEPAPEQEHVEFTVPHLGAAHRGEVVSLLLKSGLWPCIIQRPYGVIADPADTPKAVFVSGFDSAPLAPDMNFLLAAEQRNLRRGIEVMKTLSGGKVHLGLRKGDDGVLSRLEGAEVHVFDGPHPAGNVGVQIHHVDPINKGDIVWTVDVQDLAIIGRLFNTGRVDMRKVYALTGSELVRPRYVAAVSGAAMGSLVAPEDIKPQKDNGRVRLISGDPLSGTIVEPEGWVGFYANQVTVLPEGDKYEFVGWALPRLDKFSVSRTYFSWLRPGKSYVIDTNLKGGHRPFVVTGLFERYVPMDIYPMYLLKAILAGDIDKMENLGIYEVVEEDLALCEFVDPSKNEIQQMVRDGINLMIKELN